MGRQMNSAAFRAAAAAAVLAGKPAPVRKLPKPVSKPARQPVQEHVDATPERIARASDVDGVRYDRIVDATIEKAGERAKLTRQFVDRWIDRMLARKQLTYPQWFACDWYVTLHAAAHSAARVVADYGEGCGGAGRENYGQPLSARQWDARRRLRDARTAIPSNMATLFDQVVIEDVMTAFRNGQQRARFAARIASAAQHLAIAINAPGA
ncbi:hypothetical protein [Sphingomonas sp. LC-1]|uniref:hypothetical protein n=1 Tax=Sphingomonas sp. LC-1 TaxID=3110957 RepID=UPI0021BA9708|nr:hypothetical protein [Sphingomonas sp. LC-1]